MTLANKIIAFNASLDIKEALPEGIEVLNPFLDPSTRNISESFYHKYYTDNHKRVLIFGINPGRLGAGITGVPFTDPVNLIDNCNIAHSFPLKKELSSQFIYQMIHENGGCNDFYAKYLFTAISPLGFVKDGKNINYYDVKALQRTLEPTIIQWIKDQLQFNVTSHCVCLGEGANFKYLSQLNERHQFFKKIYPLAHPRFIMQYKRKALHEYIKAYGETAQKAYLEA